MKITVTYDTNLCKVVPIDPSAEMLNASGLYLDTYASMLAAAPADLPGVVEHSGEPCAWRLFSHSDMDDESGWYYTKKEMGFDGEQALFTHTPAQPTEQLYALLDKSASLLAESALSEDYDGDDALELVAAIRGEFVNIGKTTTENALEVLWENLRIAAGFNQDDEFTLKEALAKIALPAQTDTEALQATPSSVEQLQNSMQFGADMVSKYSAVCKRVAEMERLGKAVAETYAESMQCMEAQIAAQVGQEPVESEVVRLLTADITKWTVKANEYRTHIAELETEVARLDAGWHKANCDVLDMRLAAQDGKGIVIELPDGDTRTVKVWWDEVREDGKRYLCISTEPPAPANALDIDKLQNNLEAITSDNVKLTAECERLNCENSELLKVLGW